MLSLNLAIICGVIILTILMAIGIYNRLIRLKNLVQEAWSGIDIQLKRRSDLIPNLVATVQGYSQHENKLLTEITQLRSSTLNAGSIEAQVKAENGLTGALKTLFAVAENYPELKSNQNFIQLQKELALIEDHLQLSRRYYNATVRDFNTSLQSFPNNLVAQHLQYRPATFFEVSSAVERENPTVRF